MASAGCADCNTPAILVLIATFRPMECLMAPRHVFRVRLAPARDPDPSRLPPGGTEVLLSSLALAREGRGAMRWGQRRAERTGESASATWGNKATTLVCCRSFSRHVPQGCKRRVRPATLPQYRIASAHGLPDRRCVVSSACGLLSDMTPACDPGPLHNASLEGTGVSFRPQRQGGP